MGPVCATALFASLFAGTGAAADEQAWPLADQARELARSGSAEAALPLYRQALKLAPGVLEIQRDYAVTLAWAERFAESSAQFQRLLEAQPEQPEWVWREVARVELESGRPAAALPFLERLVESGDESEKTLAGKALALRRMGRQEEAQALYRQVAEKYPESPVGTVGVIQSLADQARFVEALATANLALDARRGDAHVLHAKGQVLNWLRRYDEARDVFESLPRESIDQAAMSGRLLAIFSFADASPLVRNLSWISENLAGAPDITLPDPPFTLLANPFDLERAQADAPWVYADLARELARSGATGEALALYAMALNLAPEEIALRRDYAVVLGWAERYAEAEGEFDRLLRSDPNPPEWVLREMARTKLFGGNPKGAIAVLDRMIALGNTSEETLSRKALALRWSNQSPKAEDLYRQIAEKYPRSSTGIIGIIQALADQNRLDEAIELANRALRERPGDWQILKAKGQVLNWAGRHFEAQRVFISIPDDHIDDSEVLHGKALAARWGGDPVTARDYARSFAEKYPDDPESEKLRRELDLEYGSSFDTSFRMVSDSQGFVDRSYNQTFSFHATPSQSFHAGHQYRRFSQDGVLAWNRYQAGWSGKIHRRLSGYAALSDVEYRHNRGGRRWIGDASLAWKANDELRISGGGGSIAMDAFQAVNNQLTAGFFYGQAAWQPAHRTYFEGRFSQYRFTDQVLRSHLSGSALQRILFKPRVRLSAGFSAEALWHERESSSFYSPSFFQANLGMLRAEGRLIAGFDYIAEIGTGIQREPFLPKQYPLVFSGVLAKRLHPSLRLLLEGGYNSSSISRVNPNGPAYSYSHVAISLQSRFD